MEFFLVPLIALVVVTFGIYKLTSMMFHIHLSGALLILLVVFAWMVSLILPGLFFQKAGFLGSVGISLVSAAGFAWAAAFFDAQCQSSRMTAVSTNGEVFVESSGAAMWTPPAESTAPVLPKDDWQSIAEEEIQKLLTTGEVAAEKPFVMESVAEVFQPITLLPEPVAELKETESVFVKDMTAVSDAFLLEIEELEPGLGEGPVEVENDALPSGAAMNEDVVIEQMAEPQPASDSLEDLLDFSFSQRSQGNATGALVTFRLIRGVYADSHALPMVVAEIVSILQSQGQYEVAIDELSAIMHLPTIQQDPKLVNIFAQKQNFLQLLRDLLIERGSPGLPFEQIPAEWQSEVEQGLLTGNRVQS